jgi:hypothetical protein
MVWQVRDPFFSLDELAPGDVEYLPHMREMSGYEMHIERGMMPNMECSGKGQRWSRWKEDPAGLPEAFTLVSWLMGRSCRHSHVLFGGPLVSVSFVLATLFA